MGACLLLAERDRGSLPCGSPVWRLPVGLTLLEDPVGRLRKIASGGTDGDGMAFAPAGALVEMYDVLAPPVGVIAVSDDDIGGFDESPLEVGVALLHHAAVVGSAGAGAELGDEAAVAREVLVCREPVDGTDLAIDDDGQDLGRSRHGLDELDGWCGLNAIEDPVFQLLDMVGEGV